MDKAGPVKGPYIEAHHEQILAVSPLPNSYTAIRPPLASPCGGRLGGARRLSRERAGTPPWPRCSAFTRGVEGRWEKHQAETSATQ